MEHVLGFLGFEEWAQGSRDNGLGFWGFWGFRGNPGLRIRENDPLSCQDLRP